MAPAAAHFDLKEIKAHQFGYAFEPMQREVQVFLVSCFFFVLKNFINHHDPTPILESFLRSTLPPLHPTSLFFSEKNPRRLAPEGSDKVQVLLLML